MHRAAIRKVVAVDGCNYRVGETKVFDRFSDVSRLHRVEIERITLVDGTESAMARAGIAAEHKRSRLVRPTFENVRAFRFLADCVEVQTVDQLKDGILVARVAKLDL